jgi:phosphatidylserine/phosphatidylglycerophosphate/cardiolipin synthase-like enzyme
LKALRKKVLYVLLAGELVKTELLALIVLSILIGVGVGYVVAFAQVSALQSEKAALEREAQGLQADYILLNSSYQALQEAYAQALQTKESEVKGVYFSPNGGCEEAVLAWIGRANESIHVLIFSFTLDSVGDALLDAYGRGVEVKVVFEKGQISQYSEYQRLADAGVSVRNDTNPDYMHDKVMIVDGAFVLTGSFNWSANAQENNNENLIVLEGEDIASAYEVVFQKIWTQSAG